MPTITGIAHVELSVRNLDATEAWYARIFGLQTVFSETTSENQFGVADRAMFEPKSGVVFAFTQQPENGGETFDPRRTGLDHVSFAVTDIDELAYWRDHLEGLGESPSPFVEWPGGARSFTVPDPDGIALEFFVSPSR